MFSESGLDYQTQNSIHAIGSGMLKGKGLFKDLGKVKVGRNNIDFKDLIKRSESVDPLLQFGIKEKLARSLIKVFKTL
jgi:hypothetical protein